MNTSQISDLYTDYLICSFSLASATNMSHMLQNTLSHDQVTRFLSGREFSAKEYWNSIKPILRQIESEDSVIIVDDTIEEKPYTDENEIVCYHYDHTKGTNVKGINIINFLYHREFENVEDFCMPVAFTIVSKTQKYFDEKTQKDKRRSDISKNEIFRKQLKTVKYHKSIPINFIKSIPINFIKSKKF